MKGCDVLADEDMDVGRGSLERAGCDLGMGWVFPFHRDAAENRPQRKTQFQQVAISMRFVKAFERR